MTAETFGIPKIFPYGGYFSTITVVTPILFPGINIGKDASCSPRIRPDSRRCNDLGSILGLATLLPNHVLTATYPLLGLPNTLRSALSSLCLSLPLSGRRDGPILDHMGRRESTLVSGRGAGVLVLVAVPSTLSGPGTDSSCPCPWSIVSWCPGISFGPWSLGLLGTWCHVGLVSLAVLGAPSGVRAVVAMGVAMIVGHVLESHAVAHPEP